MTAVGWVDSDGVVEAGPDTESFAPLAGVVGESVNAYL